MKLGLAAGLAVLAVLMLAYAVHILKISGSVLEISGLGIRRRENDGSETFIAWQDMGALKDRDFMQQLAVHDRAGIKRLLLDYQFEGFDLISARLLAEREKYVQYAFPAVFKRHSNLPDAGHVVLFVVIVIFCLPFMFMNKKTDILIIAGIAAIPVLAGVILYLKDLFWSVREVIVERSRFIIKKFNREKSYDFADVFYLDYKYLLNNSRSGFVTIESELIKKTGAGMRQPVLEIMMNNGKVFSLRKNEIPLVETYLCMKKTSGKGPLKMKPVLPGTSYPEL
jgi:hypothetical protein